MMKIVRLLICLLSAWAIASPGGATEASPAAPIAQRASTHTQTQDTPAPTSDAPVMRVATAASGPEALQAATVAGAPHQHGAADPPALLLFAAVLLVVVFVSTRRRPDR